MADFIEDCKKWIILVQKMDLDSIMISLSNLRNLKHNDESNKYLFKLLLHLSHCADRCYREKLSKETQIFIIVNAVCKSLISVPDKGKLFSALYYVLYYITSKKLFKEAEIICGYLFPGKFVNSKDLYKSSEYYQIATLWQSEIFKRLDVLKVSSNNKKEIIDDEFCAVMKFHLKILEFCDETLNYNFKIADTYIKKFSNISLDTAFPCLLQLFKYLLKYMGNLKKMPVKEAYNLVISMLGFAFYKRIDAINNSNVLSYFRQCDAYFLDALSTLPECYNCYKFFRDYTINIFETNFMSTSVGKLRLQKSFETLNILISKYGITNTSVCETTAAIAYSFELIYSNWESIVSKQLVNTKISYDDILNMGNFMKHVHSILKNRSLPPHYICKMCSESRSCSVKKDIYNASLTTASYIKIIVKFSTDNLSEKIFLNAMQLLEELLLVYKELDKSGCKYSSPMWDLCGRMIFNIGLISESKYPAQLEKFYKVLCTQVVHRDGVNSKISSFGLENPVGVILHRLCNINFYQEKYREAMSYAAYNALLSNYENRKKKAFDMWANIKVKVLDSPEMQELTLLMCLRTDLKIVEKLGINVDLINYDVNDLCLRELKALYSVKHNMILPMEKTLSELESTKNTLHYAQGVLFLCLHSLQFNKRKYISDYLSAAIDQINNNKLKTISNQCLLANLKFFSIIEKLYVRSQAINKQIEEANFTVKAFKTFNGNNPYDGTEDEDNIIPTYGEISIKEDNRCAKDFREVVNIWEKSIQENMIEVANCWEPKIMLEAIVICGEYCRLYKFENIEERIWAVGYELASTLQDFTTCIYITSRSISLRYINDKWINDAEKYVENIKNSSKNSDSDAVSLFWLSLADFYFDCKKIKEAKILLEKVKRMPTYDMIANSKTYIYSIDIQLRNYYIINTNPSQEEYCKLLVEIHYLIINLHDIVEQEFCKFGNIRFQLLACEQMFEVMHNIVVPMISLLSFREISAHLTDGLKIAQKLGLTIRIAQCLKYFCYIDLLRTQVEACEAKLQDLEHILCLENFKGSMKTNEKNDQLVSPEIAPIDLSTNCASPELKKKTFSSPGFLVHTPHCQCFTCSNLNYQYLSFSCTHIRAHLYSLLNYTREAEQHYYGAYKIKLRIDERESSTRQSKTYKWKCKQNYTVDTLLYLLNFSMFIVDFKPNQKEGALDLIEHALEVAAKNDLDKHCVSVYASELYFQLYIYDVFQDKLAISVPVDIPITLTNHPIDGCITPKHQVEKTSKNVMRRKSPPPIAVPVINIIGNSNVENNCGNSPIPKTGVTAEAKKPQPAKRMSARNVRRRLLVDEGNDNATVANKQEEKNTRKRSTRLSKKSLGSAVS